MLCEKPIFLLFICTFSLNNHNRLIVFPSIHTSNHTHTHQGCVLSIKRISARPVNHLSKGRICLLFPLRSDSSPPVHSYYQTWERNDVQSICHLPVVVGQHQAAPPQQKATDFIQCIYLKQPYLTLFDEPLLSIMCLCGKVFIMSIMHISA